MTRQYDNYADLITFSRSSSGTALRPISYGTELVTNGTFDTGDFTGFSTVGAAWSVIGGEAVGNDTTSLNNFLVWQDGASAGKIYLGSVDVISNDVIGNSYIQWGLDTNTRVTSPSAGTYTQIFTGSAELFRANVNASSGSLVLDNISVKEVLFDQPNALLTLFNHPAGIPRIEYDADGNRLGLLIEEARTNLVTYSNSLSQHSGVRATLSEDSALSPSGEVDAGSVVDTAVSGDHRVDFTSVTVTSGSAYTMSFFVKANGRSWLRVQMGTGGFGTAYANFDLSDGSIGTTTGVSATYVQDFGSGWYRCAVTATATASAGTTPSIQLATGDQAISYTGDGTSGIYIWGAQLEAGAFPTSYIPTSGSTATRAADIASIPVSAFGYNQSEGTLFVEYSSVASKNENYDFFIFNTNSSFNPESWGAYGRADGVNNLNGYRRSNSAYDSIDGVTSFDGNSGGKIAISQSKSNTALSSNGLLDSTSFSLSELSTITELDFANGAGVVGGKHSGHIKSIKYYPRKLSNAQLVELTS